MWKQDRRVKHIGMEDTQTKGWFSAIILAFGGQFYVC